MIDKTRYGVIRERWVTASGRDELLAAFEFKKQAVGFLRTLRPDRRAVMGYAIVELDRTSTR